MTDFGTVVVGAGSSGCAFVGRIAELSDEPICLVEAGPDYGPLADGRWPQELLDVRQFPDTHDWGWFETRDGELRRDAGNVAASKPRVDEAVAPRPRGRHVPPR